MACSDNFVGKEEKQVLRLVIGNLVNFNYSDKMDIVALPTLRRRVVVSLYLSLWVLPEPPIRDLEHATILRFLCLYFK